VYVQDWEIHADPDFDRRSGRNISVYIELGHHFSLPLLRPAAGDRRSEGELSKSAIADAPTGPSSAESTLSGE
jgi:hypothetical protein